MRYLCVALILLFAVSFCNCEGYVPTMTSETAIETVLAEGQQYFVEEFDEWQSWTVRTAEFQVVELNAVLDQWHDGTEYIWHVVFRKDDGSRSVHFVVKDKSQKVLCGWDSADAVVDYKEQPETEYAYTVEDVIIRAVLYRELRREYFGYREYENKHVYVYLDHFGWYDVQRIEDIKGYGNYVYLELPFDKGAIPLWERKLPMEKQAWRVTFCKRNEGNGEGHERECIDMRVIIGYDMKVYGYQDLSW